MTRSRPQPVAKPLNWLMLVVSIPGPQSAARVRLWRALKASGAAALRDGVYVLPESASSVAILDEQVERVQDAGGEAHVFTLFETADEEADRLIALFDRGTEYATLLERVDQLRSELTGSSEGDARRELALLWREWTSLGGLDFFPGKSRSQAESSLNALEHAVNTRFSPDEPKPLEGSVQRRRIEDYQGRTWATRAKLWIDRAASAWLIRRYIDPKARFLWLSRAEDCPPDAFGFDFDGAAFTHAGDRVTFEVLVASFGLDRDPGLVRLGQLVHVLDVGGVEVPEAPGIVALMAGARDLNTDDDVLLVQMSGVFDALYASYRAKPHAKAAGQASPSRTVSPLRKRKRK